MNKFFYKISSAIFIGLTTILCANVIKGDENNYPQNQLSEYNVKEPARKPELLVIDNKLILCWETKITLDPGMAELINAIEEKKPKNLKTKFNYFKFDRSWCGDQNKINELPIVEGTLIHRMQLRYCLLAEDGEIESLPLHPKVFSVYNFQGDLTNYIPFPDYRMIIVDNKAYLVDCYDDEKLERNGQDIAFRPITFNFDPHVSIKFTKGELLRFPPR